VTIANDTDPGSNDTGEVAACVVMTPVPPARMLPAASGSGHRRTPHIDPILPNFELGLRSRRLDDGLGMSTNDCIDGVASPPDATSDRRQVNDMWKQH